MTGKLMKLIITGGCLAALVNCASQRPKQLDSVIYSDGIRFEESTAKFAQSSFKALDKMHDLLITFPEAKFEIICHVSSGKDSISSLLLASRRAKEIRNYLVTNGVFHDRLVIRGFGSASSISNGNGHGNGKTDLEKRGQVVFRRIQ